MAIVVVKISFKWVQTSSVNDVSLINSFWLFFESNNSIDENKLSTNVI